MLAVGGGWWRIAAYQSELRKLRMRAVNMQLYSTSIVDRISFHESGTTMSVHYEVYSK